MTDSVPAKFDLSRLIMTIEGKPFEMDFVHGNGEADKRSLTLRDACVRAVITDIPGAKVSEMDKLERYMLAMRLKNEEDEIVSLDSKEIEVIKAGANDVFGVMIFGQVHKMLGEVVVEEPEMVTKG